MTQRMVKPDDVKTLKDWVSRWPKAGNLGFDPDTREATIYTQTKERTKVSSIPWKREADTLTVLAQPTRFSAQAVAAATSRYGKIHEQRENLRIAGEEQLRIAEMNLLDAWRAYNATPADIRAPLRRDILSAEGTLRELEESLANKGRSVITVFDDKGKDMMKGIYITPMPLGRRGISLVASAASEEATSFSSASASTSSESK